MSRWVPGTRRRVQLHQNDKFAQLDIPFLPKKDVLYDAYEARHMFKTKFLSYSKGSFGRCWYCISIPANWMQSIVVLSAGVAITFALWLSDDSSIAGLRWPWKNHISPPAAANVILMMVVGIGYLLLGPHVRRGGVATRALMPHSAKPLIWLTWLALNVFWFIAGIGERDFRKPSWLKQSRVPSRAQHLSELELRLLHLMYGVGMACAWPLLANLAVVLLPVDRGLFLLACLGAGHEEGVLAHALCGTAVWMWAAAHALLTQVPMLAAGLWRTVMLPDTEGAETKATTNFMGLMAFMALCTLGLSSRPRLRRTAFNAFQRLHLVLAPAVLLFACLHKGDIFWYGILGAVLYSADLVQRWMLRRRTAIATATVYPHFSRPSQQQQSLPAPPVLVGGLGAATSLESRGSKFVVLRIPTGGCPPGSVAGQHLFLNVPSISRWEWHPYSVAAHDQVSFALVIKAAGDWERRLCSLIEDEVVAVAGSRSGRLKVMYEGLYGTGDLQAAAVAADHVLLFAGGSGITPVASVLQALLLSTPRPPPPLPAPRLQSQLVEHVGPRTLNVESSKLSPSLHPQQHWMDVGATSAVEAWLKPVKGGPEAIAVVQGGWEAKQRSPIPPALPPAGSRDRTVLGGLAVSNDVVRGGARAVGDAVFYAGSEEVEASAPAPVHLVWAVTQQSDAEPLLPLLRCAASRGWRVDLHCTQSLLEPLPQVAVAGIGDKHPLHAAATTTADAGAPILYEWPAATAAPWQLHGAACWAVAAGAALFGAVGGNLLGTAASTHTCQVAAGPGVLDDDSARKAWVAAVRAAFHPALITASSAGADDDITTIGSSWAGRLASALLRGSASASVLNCPRLLSVEDQLREGAAAVSKGGSPVANLMKLRVCRTWGGVAPELCIKCDPFKAPASKLEASWPCCQARVCFFAAQLAPLLGWVVGMLLGAALVCVVWRWWRSEAYWGLGGPGPRRRLLLATRCTGTLLCNGRVCDDDVEASGNRFLSHNSSVNPDATARSLDGSIEKEVSAPGLEALLHTVLNLNNMGALSDGVRTAAQSASGDAAAAALERTAVGSGIRIHVGRPNVDTYISAAAAAGHAALCSQNGRVAYGDEVYGVVVCGPEALQADVQAAYVRHVHTVYPRSWFRGFSFTT